jgi:hypothetical protein
LGYKNSGHKSLIYTFLLQGEYYSVNQKINLKRLLLIYGVGIILSALVAGCGGTDNVAPVITSFQANPSSVSASGQATLLVSATDADGDPLTYTYQPSGGAVSGNSNTAIWIAPDKTGSYIINVSVSDGKLSTQSSVVITVGTQQIEDKTASFVGSYNVTGTESYGGQTDQITDTIIIIKGAASDLAITSQNFGVMRATLTGKLSFRLDSQTANINIDNIGTVQVTISGVGTVVEGILNLSGTYSYAGEIFTFQVQGSRV